MQTQLNGSKPTMQMVSGQMSPSPESAGISPSQTARIEVIGVGGGGSNAVNRMIQSDLEGGGPGDLENVLRKTWACSHEKQRTLCSETKDFRLFRVLHNQGAIS